MKKIFLLLSSIAIAAVFTSCEDEEDIHVYNSGDIAYFSETNGDYNENSSNNHVAALSDVSPDQQNSIYKAHPPTWFNPTQ